MLKTQIIQIAYDEPTIDMCCVDNRVIHCIRSESGPYLENEVISKINYKMAMHAKYIGVLSARFEEKRRWRQTPLKSIPQILDFIENDPEDIDVYSFFGSNTARNIWIKAEQWQPGILKIAQLLFEEFEQVFNYKVGDITKLDTPIIYQNAFIAKSSVYLDYVQNFLNPLIVIMERNKQIKDLLMKDARYTEPKLSREKMIETFGVPYYTFHAFVCERFFSTYMALNKDIFSIKHI